MSKASEKLKNRVALLRGITQVSRGVGKERKGTENVKDSVTKKGQPTSPKSKRPEVR